MALHRIGSAAVFAPGLPPRRAVPVVIDVLPLTPEVTATLRHHAARRRSVDLRLDPSLCLTKLISLPSAARRAAAKAIDLQLRQQMPARAAGLVWRFEPAGRSGKTRQYRVYIFKQQELTQLLQTAAGLGVDVRCIGVASANRVAPFFQRRTRADRVARIWHGLAAGLAIAAICTVLVQQARSVAAYQSRADALNTEVTALLDRAAAEQARIIARDATLSDRLTDVQRFNSDYRRFPVIADLTDGLDDDVWISSLTLDGDSLRIAGFSRTDLSETVQKLRTAPWAAEVVIDGPVVVDPVRRENRFQLRVALRPIEVPL